MLPDFFFIPSVLLVQFLVRESQLTFSFILLYFKIELAETSSSVYRETVPNLFRPNG